MLLRVKGSELENIHKLGQFWTHWLVWLHIHMHIKGYSSQITEKCINVHKEDIEWTSGASHSSEYYVTVKVRRRCTNG